MQKKICDNTEEIDRATAFTLPAPIIYCWTIEFMKILFDKLSSHHGHEDLAPLSEFLAILVHCQELRNIAIRFSRLTRNRENVFMSFKQA